MTCYLVKIMLNKKELLKKLIGLNQIILDTTYDVDTMREKVIPIIDKIRDTLSQEGK